MLQSENFDSIIQTIINKKTMNEHIKEVLIGIQKLNQNASSNMKYTPTFLVEHIRSYDVGIQVFGKIIFPLHIYIFSNLITE